MYIYTVPASISLLPFISLSLSAFCVLFGGLAWTTMDDGGRALLWRIITTRCVRGAQLREVVMRKLSRSVLAYA